MYLRYGILGVLMFLLTVPLFAGGRSEADPIEQARTLIVEKQYDQAILILSEVISLNDERLDEAERLMRQIRSIRSNYNDLFQELYDVIRLEPENNDKILGIINRMLALDQYPNTRTRDQIEKARLTAKLQVDRAVRNKIIEDARALIAQGQYSQAIALYVTGFYLQRDEFSSGIQTQEFKDQVLAIINGITTTQEPLPRIEQPLKAAITSLVAKVSVFGGQTTEVSAIQADIDAVRGLFQPLAERRNQLTTFSSNLTDARAQGEKDNPAYILNEYIRFIQEFMNGPPNRASTDGIILAINRLTETTIDSWMTPLTERVKQEEGVFSLVLSQDDPQAIRRGISRISDVYGLFNRAAFATVLTTPPQNLQAQDLGRLLDRHRDPVALYWLLAQSYQYLDELVVQWQARPQAVPATATLASLIAAYSNSVQFLNSTDQVMNRWDGLQRTALTVSPGLAETLGRQTSLLQTWRDRVKNDTFAVTLDTMARIGTLQLADAQGRYTEALSRFTDVNNLLNGVETESGEGTLVRYPDRALAQLPALEASLNQGLSTLGEIANRHTVSPGVLSSQGSIRTIDQSVSSLSTSIRNLLTRYADIRTKAQENIARSREFQRLAEVSVTAVQTAIRQENVPNAIARLQEVGTNFTNALELQENASLRGTSSRTIAELQTSIQNLRVKLAIDRVRILKAQATAFFDREEFENALQTVEEAQELFSSVQEGRDIELDRLFQRIIAAATLTRERFFTEADPAYNILANYLSLAKLDLDAAKNTRGDAQKVRLDRADQSLDNILAIKPNNWDAKILKLEITRLSDPGNFAAAFERRYREILSRESPVTKNDTLIELQVLENFNRNFPGLQANIRRLEIELGLRESEVTIANRNRSLQLTSQARALSNSREITDLQRALALLTEAITLNPANEDAKILADSIRIRVGTPPTITLSPQDEQQFRQAQRLRGQGSLLAANNIINTLWQNPINRRYPPLIAEKAAIERALNL